MDEKINKMVSTHTMDYVQTQEGNFDTCYWYNIGESWEIMLSEMSQSQKDKYCMISLIWGADPQLVESIDAEPADPEGWLHNTILYKGLEHSQILVSTGGPGTNPPQIPRDNCIRIIQCHLMFLQGFSICFIG